MPPTTRSAARKASDQAPSSTTPVQLGKRKRGEASKPAKARKARGRNALSDSAPPAGVPAQGINELPVELVWKIVELRINDHEGGRDALLRDLSSLSLASRVWRVRCQMEIFRCITLQPAVWYDYTQRIQGPRNMQRFVDVVENNPTLGSYVRTLVYRLQGRDTPRAEIERVDPAPAFATMDGLVGLSIEVGGIKQDVFLFHRDEHAHQVYRLMQLETLESLKLQRVKLPVKKWALTKRFQTLEFDNSIFEITDDWYFPEWYTKSEAGKDLPPISARHMTIRCDLKTTLDNLTAIKEVEDRTKRNRLPLDLANVESIQMYSHNPSTTQMLTKLKALKELLLHTPHRTLNPADAPNPSPLHGLTRACFGTLTVLSYDIGIYMHALQPLRDPYRGLFRSHTRIMQLVALEEITVNIDVIARNWNEHPDDLFNEHWRGMVDVLTYPHTDILKLPKLKRVTLFVVLNHSGKQVEAVEKFSELFREKVLDAKFTRLRELATRGVIDVTLEVDDWDHRDDPDREWFNAVL